MKRIWKCGLTGALAGAAAIAIICSPTVGSAQDFDPGLTHWEAANTLIMPYDVTGNHESFQIVSKIGPAVCDDPADCENPIATHWAFWSKDCDHLGDVFICLTQNDTVVVDPKHLQAQTQKPDKSGALLLGDEINVDKVGGDAAKGLVTVTAYRANIGQSGLGCEAVDAAAFDDGQLVGGWTIANTSTGAAFGNDAVGLATDGTIPVVPAAIDSTNVRIQTFNPTSLGDSLVMLLGVQDAATTPQGVGIYANEIAPMAKSSQGDPTVRCDATVYDNLENARSLPRVEFTCAGFAPISDNIGKPSILGPGIPLNSSGFVKLDNCTSFNEDPNNITCSGPSGRCIFSPNGDRQDQFLFGFHGQSIGTFGAMISGKYTNASIGSVGG
jgi:hypothetical protein